MTHVNFAIHNGAQSSLSSHHAFCFQLQPLTLILCRRLKETHHRGLMGHEQGMGPIRAAVTNTEVPACRSQTQQCDKCVLKVTHAA